MTRLVVLLVLLLGPICRATEYYVSTDGNNQNDGRSEESAWRTISHAARIAKAGDTVWIKASNYGAEFVEVLNSGNPNNPIAFIGYKSKKDDLKDLYYTYSKGRAFDPSEMPLLDGGNRANGEKAITINKKSYVVLKNLQIQNYRWGVHGGSASFCVLDGILAGSFGDLNTKVSGYGAQFGTGGNNTIKNSIFINATGANLRIEGDNNLIDNVKSYADDNSTEMISATDYYIHINGGNNNIIRNSHVERVGDLKHTGHGFGLKYDCENNLIENCTSVNVKGAVELRHSGVKNNLVRNVRIIGPQGSITIRDGAHDNVIENCEVFDSNEGIRFYDQTEDGMGGLIASGNLIRNCVFSNLGAFIVATKSSKVSAIGYVSENKVINCTVDDVGVMYKGDLPMDGSNEIVNCIFTRIQNFEARQSRYGSEWKHISNNFFEAGFTIEPEDQNISENPGFRDSAKRDYRLKSNSKMIDAGQQVNEVKKDMDGKSRPQGDSHDLGAFEYHDDSTGSVDTETESVVADAGNDQFICKGEEVVLVAKGGASYEWSTGETSDRITVSPEQTTTYKLTAFEGDVSDEDEITVFVSNVVAFAGSDLTITKGESIKLTANGGVEYLWSNGDKTKSITVSPQTSTVYTVTVSENGCSDTDQVKVVVENGDSGVEVEAYAGEDQTICLGESVELVGTGNGDFLWSTGERTESIEVNPERTTTYEFIVSRNGIEDVDYVTVTVQNCLEEDPSDSSLVLGSEPISEITVYPNPASDHLNVEADNMLNEANLDLISLSGQVMYRDFIESDQRNYTQQIDLTSFERGVYFVRVYNQDEYHVKKIVMI